MRKVSRLFLVLLILNIFSTMSICASQNDLVIRNKVGLLFNSGNYSEIIKKLKNYQWSTASTPLIIMQYIYSINELDLDYSHNFNSTKVPSYVFRYSLGYRNLIIGNVVKAKKIFLSMSDFKDSGYWKKIGLLEYSMWTGSTELMLPIILKIKKTYEKYDKKNKLIPYYEVYYYYNSNDFNTVVHLLEKHKEHLDRITYTELKVDALINNNEFTAATKLLNKIKEDIVSNIAIQKSELLFLSVSNNESLKYLYSYLNEHPSDWNIKREIAYGLIRKNNVEEGLSVLLEIYSNRPSDYYFIISLLDVLIDYARSENEIKSIKNIMNKVKDNEGLVGIINYHLLMAKILSIADKKKEALNQMEYVNEVAPNNIKLLWMYADLFKEEKKYQKAVSAIEKIGLLQPNNIEVLYSLIDIYEITGDKKKVNDVNFKLENMDIIN